MKSAFFTTIAVLMAMGTCVSPALAMNNADVIDAYNGIIVDLAPATAQCGIRGEDRFRAQLRNTLKEIGLPRDTAQPVHAHLGIAAQQLPSMDDKCMISITLAFIIPLKAEFISVSERVSHRKVIDKALEQVDSVPIVLYEEGEFDAEYPTAAEGRALYLVQQVVERFAGQRSRR
jgi:hypothetical protein